MTEQELSQIAEEISTDIQFWVAWVGVVGVIIGSILTVFGNLSIEWYKNRSQMKIDKACQALLKDMLQSYNWRSLRIMSSVIGCSEEQTKAYLIAIGARGSEKEDGKWGLISRNPLPTHDN